ncbi:hypothetical protein LCI18_007781 [Fusarium solani-melongenae]|uniref:Uncharacterized protein n=1 Tax=Fusarium solani subsp. cucurbitae TaxID=2747967 RepID=A0ACD3Z7M1_FUSSC|nr:hypothetical protein LCI18_007781 [Fusarium solani-melongenae]
MLSTKDYTHFKVLYDLVYEKESKDIPQLFHKQSIQKHGKALLVKLSQDKLKEEEEELVQEQENGTRGHMDKSNSPAISRKLTLMSAMNPDFIADKRLWLWIEKALKPADSG